ncbi:MAG: arginine--tRNA ligase [Rhodospirillales bacterium]|nr:arginine--tRNA ligase [Rhodospirillales bacterium]
MNLYRFLQASICEICADLAADGLLPADLDLGRITVEPPRDPSHGDVATNAALVLAGPAGRKPRMLATMLAERLLATDGVATVEVAGPGFINLRLTAAFWYARLAEILHAGVAYGDSTLGGGEPVNVEHVSANPTGPLHVGHGRGAVVGDALGALLEKAGFAVTREYYVNDAGAQVDKLARAVYWRYLCALGESIADGVAERYAAQSPPEYGGDYLIAVGESLVASHGDSLVGLDEGNWLATVREAAVAAMMALIAEDLKALGMVFDVISSERALVEDGAVEMTLSRLQERDLIYTGVLEPPKGKLPDDWEPRPQTLFRSTAFGDDVDRPLRKSDGSWTYFASDIAYHLDKHRRGFRVLIDVWGADHGGYVKRMQSAVRAISEGRAELDVKLCQMVNLLDAGQPIKMSKRAGTFITLREVLDRVGRDVFRFIMLTRRNDAPLDFDFEKVTEQSRENPVFYVQYAHARCHSVIRHAEGEFGAEAVTDAALAAADLALLTDPAELDLIKAMAAWPRLVEGAAEAHEPHRIAFYLQDLAGLFHLLWTKGKDDAQLRFVTIADRPLTLARMALVRAIQTVLASGLKVIGVEAVEELR